MTWICSRDDTGEYWSIRTRWIATNTAFDLIVRRKVSPELVTLTSPSGRYTYRGRVLWRLIAREYGISPQELDAQVMEVAL